MLAQCELPADLVASITELTALKSKTREMGSGEPPRSIANFIDDEFARAAPEFAMRGPRDLTAARAVTEQFFRTEALAPR